jgi:hypothetical protein
MAVLSLCTAAAADFAGLSLSYTDDGTHKVAQLFATFDDATDITLSIYNVNFVPNSGFNQSDGGGGMWLPFFSTLGGDTSIDSYVNLNASGTAPVGAFGAVNLDPNFGSGMGDTIPENAGWYYSPTLPPVQGMMVHLGQFVLSPGEWIGGYLTVGWKREGTTETFGSVAYLYPTPGAMALLGIAGVATRRRRG